MFQVNLTLFFENGNKLTSKFRIETLRIESIYRAAMHINDGIKSNFSKLPIEDAGSERKGEEFAFDEPGLPPSIVYWLLFNHDAYINKYNIRIMATVLNCNKIQTKEFFV